MGVQQFAHTPFCTHTQGLVCGHLPSRPHARLLSHTQAASCHMFCSAHGNCPSVLYKKVTTLFLSELPSVLQGTRQLPSVHVSRWQLSLYRVAMCFCMVHGNCHNVHVHGNCPNAHVSRWKLFLLHGNCPSMLVSTWQLSQLPMYACDHTWQLQLSNHDNCSCPTWQPKFSDMATAVKRTWTRVWTMATAGRAVTVTRACGTMRYEA